MEKYLLGIDIGTSSCKAALFERDGRIVGQTTRDYPVFYPHPGWAEQNPEDWWEAVCAAVRSLLAKHSIPPAEIAGIGVDGQSWSAIAVDAKGQVLANTPIWMDTRAEECCRDLRERIGEKRLFQVCGNPLKPSYTLPKVQWYGKYRPEDYQKTEQILQSNGFIVYRLTGVRSQDKSQGYGWHCFAMRRGDWDRALCGELGIPPSLLPEIYDCHQVVGRVTAQAAEKTGLAEGTPVVAGGLDAACGALGAGVLHAGETQEQGGQAGGMSICLEEYQSDERLILGCHVVPDRWLLQGGTVGGGGVLRWFDREFGNGNFKELDALAAEVPPGSDGVVFLPYLAGERSPIWNPQAKGVYYGLDFSKTKGHFVRAALEGVGYSLKHNLDTAEQAGAVVEELLAVGGAANSGLWTQMKADITGKPVKVPTSDAATTLGAALLAGVGVGFYRDFEEAVGSTVKITREYQPNSETQPVYRQGYQRYLELYRRLEPMMKEVHDVRKGRDS